MISSEIFVINYSVRGGIGGWVEVEVNYDSNTKELETYKKPEIVKFLQLDPIKIDKQSTRKVIILSNEEEEELMKAVKQTGYLESKEKPQDDFNATDGYTTFLNIILGNKSRKVSFYSGLGGRPTVPEPIQKTLTLIINKAFPSKKD